jgi:hypothetical protein
VGAILHKRFPRQVELPFYVFLGLSHRADRYIPRQSQTLVKAASGVADAIVVEIDHRRLLLALHVQLIRAYILLLLLSDVLPDHSLISPTGDTKYPRAQKIYLHSQARSWLNLGRRLLSASLHAPCWATSACHPARGAQIPIRRGLALTTRRRGALAGMMAAGAQVLRLLV